MMPTAGGPAYRRVVFAAVLAGAAGCASAPLPPPAAVREAASQARSYSGSVRVRLKGPELRGRVRALVAFQRPDALRVEVPGPAGLRLAAVARGGRLVAVFPSDRAVYEAEATAEAFEALLGLALTPSEVMDVLVGRPPARVRAYQARWGPRLPRRIEARLPDGAFLTVQVDEAELQPDLPATAFNPPAHPGFRSIEAEEARGLWGRR